MSAQFAPRLAAGIRPVAGLSNADRLAMYRLYETYYEGTDFGLFGADLAAKTHVIELRAQGVLRGFSTILLLEFDVGGAPNRAIFSGDTIIDAEYWGEQALVDAFCRFAGRTKAWHPGAPLYWFLISKGYRTYRYLSLFAHAYYPHHARPTPPEMQSRMETLARARFGDAYDSSTGIVRFERSHGHLRARWATVGDHLQERHAVVQFFLQRNPGFHAGDEMVCFTELCVDNLRSFARRAFVRGLNEPDGGTGA
jgi:hypothetical protein